MFGKFLNLLKRIEKRMAYENCYKKQEWNGIGAFGMCGEWVSPECLKCPYWIDISEVKGNE